MLLKTKVNRAMPKWTPREQLLRVLWSLMRPLFRYSPRVFWSWRVFILRLFGASIGSDVHIYPTAMIALPWNLAIGAEAAIGDRAILYNLGRISIGDGATVSQGAHLCAGTHDYRRADLPLLKQTIAIGEGAWICADAFVGPGVKIGEYAIVGARAVAVRDVGDWSIVVGNPTKIIGQRPRPISE
jgi:putative colanic acid biosynthesis acetyltransferase WcaF